uniref:Fibronectin type-III domain-containing protein n=1 Tax=Amphimedon queenslandica TaxID=400682 RepID=A0A1X7VWR7_AMPQE
GQFNTVLTVDGLSKLSLVSDITFTPTLSISNYTVQCANGIGASMNCSIVIAGTPTPYIGSFAYGPTPTDYVGVGLDLPQIVMVEYCGEAPITLSRTLSGFRVGLEYTVEMAATNILGTGPITSATISISATPSMTPSSSLTETTSPFSAGAIIAGIVVIIIVVLIGAYKYTQIDHSAKSSSSKRQAPPKPSKSLETSRNAPPQEGAQYAVLDHSSSSSGRRNQKPKVINQVTYSHVSRHDRR